MKKIIMILSAIALILGISACSQNKKINLDFATSLTVNYADGQDNVKTQTVKAEDMQSIIGICNGTTSIYATACYFGPVEFVFEGDGKTAVLYPSCDSCPTIKDDKDRCYLISDGNREKLIEILNKYCISLAADAD